MSKVRERPATEPFLTIGRLSAAAVLYVLLAVIPPSPLDRSLFMLKLITSNVPTSVAVPVAGVAVDAASR